MPQSATPKGHYVYRLIDPRDGQCFYIGKGVGRRAWAHASDAAAGRRIGSVAKNEQLLAILALGQEIGVEIVQEFDCADDALRLELRLIHASPWLTNERAGHDPAIVVEHRLKQLKTAKRSALKRKSAGQAYVRRQMERVRRLTGSQATIDEAEKFYARQAADLTARCKLVAYLKS